jgi:hypothetical protein
LLTGDSGTCCETVLNLIDWGDTLGIPRTLADADDQLLKKLCALVIKANTTAM